MGERGPAPLPTRILEMRGSWRAKARGKEPKPGPGRPRCPRWIRPEAKKVWEKLIPQLDAMGILARCDENALVRYCQAWAMWRAAHEWLVEHGDVYAEKDASGRVTGLKEYPQVARVIKLGEQLLRLERQFGLTPSARAGLALQDRNPDKESPKARYFKHIAF